QKTYKMFSTIFRDFILNPYLVYVISIGIIIFLIWRLYIEFYEYLIKEQCRRQNLKFVRIPSQSMALLRKKRYDIVETEMIKTNGKLFGANMLNEMTIYVADAELVQIICNREFTKFSNRRVFLLEDPVWDNLLFATNDEKWKRLRSIMSPAFSSGKLRKFKYCIDDTFKIMAMNLDKSIARDPVINVKQLVGAFTMDTIIQISMGMRIDSLKDPNNLIIKYARKLFGHDINIRDTLVFFIAFFHPKLLKYLHLRFQGEAIDYFKKCVLEIVEKKRKEMKNRQESMKATNFIELVLEVEKEQESMMSQQQQQQNGNAKPFKHITIDEMIAQCITFFTVGYDTTATTITNTCYTMATNPEKQEKLYKSIIETLEQLANERDDGCNDPYELITFDTLNRFEYLNACLNESMRFLTLVAATERLATEDCRIETSDKKIWFNVKKGNVIRIPILSLHKDSENFSQPDQFIPERFLPEQNNDVERNFNKYAFMPFGTGPRKCIASNLAILEAKMALIHLFRMYRLSVDQKRTKIPIDYYINADLLISKDVYLHVEQRL
ncbi:Cytochrome P450 3A4, partial [Dermatophagoides pteronyssinus]